MTSYLIPFLSSALLATFYHFRVVRFSGGVFLLFVLALALFAGLRFETGQDWLAYESYFELLDIRSFDLGAAFPFEPGFYALNYFVKDWGGSYHTVMLFASLFCGYMMYRLTRQLGRVNAFYVLTIYISYSFLIMHFAQVRQSIAMGFLLLGCAHYIRTERWLQALGIAMLGLLFQYSSIAYVAIFAIALAWPVVRRARKAVVIAAVLLLPIVLYLLSGVSPYGLLTYVAVAGAADKIEIYREAQEGGGAALFVFGGYLCALAVYFWRNLNRFDGGELFVMRMAILSLVATVVAILVFRESYVMYSRTYLLACIFHACAAALVFTKRRGMGEIAVFFGTLGVGLIYYVRAILINFDQYAPYRWVL